MSADTEYAGGAAFDIPAAWSAQSTCNRPPGEQILPLLGSARVLNTLQKSATRLLYRSYELDLRSSRMAIPPKLNDTWTFLHKEVIWLHGRWELYNQLYGESSERIDFLNRTAPTFFALLQGILLNDVQLTLSKLADPAATGNRRNLTLETLLQEIEAMPEPQFAAQLKLLLARYQTACGDLRTRRNKDIAHFDFATQVSPGGKAAALPGPSRKEIDTALQALRKFMATVLGHFERKHMAYEMFSLHDGANQILFVLKQGLRYDQLVESGAVGLDDLAKSPYFRV
jgi:HEPN superfamily AbiU2-like protein